MLSPSAVVIGSVISNNLLLITMTSNLLGLIGSNLDQKATDICLEKKHTHKFLKDFSGLFFQFKVAFKLRWDPQEETCQRAHLIEPTTWIGAPEWHDSLIEALCYPLCSSPPCYEPHEISSPLPNCRHFHDSGVLSMVIRQILAQVDLGRPHCLAEAICQWRLSRVSSAAIFNNKSELSFGKTIN